MKVLFPVLVILLLASCPVFQAQKANFRPYNPIQNIFESIFRAPNGNSGPGIAGLGPPPPPPQKANKPSAPPSNIKPKVPPRGNFSGPGLPPPQGGPPAPGDVKSQPQKPPQKPKLPPPPPPPGFRTPRPKPQHPALAPQGPNGPPPHRGHHGHGHRPPPPKPKVPLRGPQLSHSPPRIILRPQTPFGQPQPQQAGQQHPPQLPPLHPFHKQKQQQGPSTVDLISRPSSSSSTEPNLPPTIIDELNKDVPLFTTSQQQQQQHVDNPFIAPHIELGLGNGLGAAEEDPDEDEDHEEVAPVFTQQIKLTPRGHSAPVIISKVPVRAFQSSQGHSGSHSSHGNHASSSRGSDDFFFGAQTEPLPQAQPLVQGRQEPRFLDTDLISAATQDSPNILTLSQLTQSQQQQQHGPHHHEHDHHQHQHHGQHPSPVDNRRTDHGGLFAKRIDEVRELVDCGGRDLGFCDMSSKYPDHMMGHLMSECQEAIYKGFVPVPDDLEELLGEENPSAKYSNSSKSSERARHGSWSWKPYRYEKKQACDSELRLIRPGYAKDSTGKWQVIVQTEKLPQRVAIDLCHKPNQACFSMSDCGRKSRCLQRYTYQHLLAVDPDNLHDCPTIRAFKFPTACLCHIELEDKPF